MMMIMMDMDKNMLYKILKPLFLFMHISWYWMTWSLNDEWMTEWSHALSLP